MSTNHNSNEKEQLDNASWSAIEDRLAKVIAIKKF
jgi:hypothetical protein